MARKQKFLKRDSGGRWRLSKTGRFASKAQIKGFLYREKVRLQKVHKEKTRATKKGKGPNSRSVAAAIRRLYRGRYKLAIVETWRHKVKKTRRVWQNYRVDIWPDVESDQRAWRKLASEAVAILRQHGYRRLVTVISKLHQFSTEAQSDTISTRYVKTTAIDRELGRRVTQNRPYQRAGNILEYEAVTFKVQASLATEKATFSGKKKVKRKAGRKK